MYAWKLKRLQLWVGRIYEYKIKQGYTQAILHFRLEQENYEKNSKLFLVYNITLLSKSRDNFIRYLTMFVNCKSQQNFLIHLFDYWKWEPAVDLISH